MVVLVILGSTTESQYKSTERLGKKKKEETNDNTDNNKDRAIPNKQTNQ